MKYLLDVNALIAVGNDKHEHRQRVDFWMGSIRRRARESTWFATCAITELGFVRIATTKTCARFAGDIETARMLLRRTKLEWPFVFLGDELGAEALPAWVTKSKQTTDGHLLELARSHQAQLATLDTGIPGALLIPELPNSGWRVEEPAAHYGAAA